MVTQGKTGGAKETEQVANVRTGKVKKDSNPNPFAQQDDCDPDSDKTSVKK